MKNPFAYTCLASFLIAGLSPLQGDVLPAPNMGWIDVTQYGATPNDGVDDTAAIQTLINQHIAGPRNGTGIKTIYFPEGVYTITDTLEWKNSIGEWQAHLIFQGPGRAKTILRLKDNTFTDPANPKAVIYTASSRGADAEEKPLGEGNTAFFNFIKDLTVDTGTGNPGAIGIDYLNSNMGGIRNVLVISSDPDRVGVTGISMARKWPGPAFLKNVEVVGFNRGMDFFEQTTYLTTMEEIYLSEQKVVGIRNNAHPLNIRKLFSSNSVPVLTSADSSTRDSALTVIIDGVFSGGDALAYAIEYEMGLYLRDIEISGYRASPIRDNNNGVDAGSSSIDEYVSHAPYSKFESPARSLHLPIEETPEGPQDPVTDWVAATALNAPGIQAAVDQANAQGKSTIYLPFGQYFLTEPITIYGSVRRVVGNGCSLLYRASTDDLRVFIVENLDGPDITFENFLTRDLMAAGSFTWIYHDSAVAIVLKDILSYSGGIHYHNARATKVFIENVAFGNTTFTNAKVWARGFDPEDQEYTKITNVGSDLWILGLKTEWPSTVLENRSGGRTELLGTFFYPPFGSNPRAGGIAIINEESSLSFVGLSNGEANRIQVRDIRDGITRDYTISDSFAAGHPKQGLTTPLYTSYRESIGPSDWFGYPVDENGWTDTGNWIGFLNVRDYPWVWVTNSSKYAWFLEASGWIYYQR
ncbi:MAG: glycosyl hydrolase family 28-related protein [Puniceicoccaceae bacterium]